MPATLSRTKRTVSLLVLGLIVMASATQTEVANYLGATKGYSKPYFTFFLTHSFFTILFPLHLLVLRAIRPKDSPRSLLERLRQVVAVQLKVDAEDARAVHQKVLAVVLKLTALISLPSICWYIAVPLTGTTDLTTIYATATFWTYGFSLLLLKTPLSRLVVASIFIAFSGVLLITYSGVAEAKHKHRHDSGQHKGEMETEPPHRMLGDLIMLVGAIVLGFYEVIYKKALPEGQGGMISGPVEGEDNPDGGLYQSVSNDDGGEPQRPVLPTHRRSFSNPSPRSSSDAYPPDAPLDSGTRLNGTFKFAPPPVARPKLPLALHANMLTSMIGVMTLCLFWIPIPLLHWVGWEPFELPWGSWGLMAIVCTTGAIYNAGFMILIGLLGPTTASVANLLTIGLVAVTDAFYLGHTTPFWTLVGAGLVGAGFGTLLWAGEEDQKAFVDAR